MIDIQTTCDLYRNNSNEGRIVVQVTIDGRPHDVLHVVGPFELVKQYYEGVITLDEYHMTIAGRKLSPKRRPPLRLVKGLGK